MTSMATFLGIFPHLSWYTEIPILEEEKNLILYDKQHRLYNDEKKKEDI